MDGRQREWVRQRALNVIGHELRTPVATIRGIAELLGATPDADQPELVDALLRNTRRLEALVDQLLTATGITTALPAGPGESVDLVAQVRALWPEEVDGLEIKGAGVVLARRVSVERVFGAVLENARAYGDLPVSVTLKGVPGRVRASVDSPGPALSPEDVQFALQPFWRGERAVTTRPGLGLGLAVASALARHEGGRLRVRARAKGGLITVVEMPAG